MSFRLDGKRALVTGCRGRLGPVWAEALRTAGAKVVEVDIDNFDITNATAVANLGEAIPPIDILVNNAGVDDRPRPGVDEPWPRYDTARQMVMTNLYGTYVMLNEFGEAMAKAGGGVIINIASLYGLVVPDDKLYSHLHMTSGLPGTADSDINPCKKEQFHKHPMYGATKAGIISLTKYYAAYYGQRGVRVNAIAPGGVIDPADPLTGQDHEFTRKYTAKIPMGRMCTPADLGGALVYLASDASGFMTGQTLVLDGGFTCW